MFIISRVKYYNTATNSWEYTDIVVAGQNSKSAYEYAVEGGYTGTEEEFAAKLAADIPSDDHINSLIDTKLGVIENGTY